MTVNKTPWQAPKPDATALTMAQQILKHQQGGFDHALADGTIGLILESLNLGALLLKEECQRLIALPVSARENIDVGRMSNMLAKATKSIDDLTRLRAFSEGKPDSRPDHSNNLLQGLTDKQIETIYTWIEDNQRMLEAKEIN